MSRKPVHLAAIAYLCFSGLSSAAPASQTSDVFLLGGQSNMVGIGVFAEVPAPYSEPLPNVTIWDGTAWVSVPDYAKKLPTCGPEVSFAHAIAKLLPGHDIKLIKYGEGGTSLYQKWAPEQGPQYILFMKTADAALANLREAGQKYKVDGMCWLQGESDAQENMGKEYEKNLKAFIENMRTKFATPDMPFVIARVRDIYGHATGEAKIVRDAQDKIGRSVKNATCFNTDDCELQGNGAHYSTVGLIKIGDRFADGYAKIAKRSNYTP